MSSFEDASYDLYPEIARKTPGEILDASMDKVRLSYQESSDILRSNIKYHANRRPSLVYGRGQERGVPFPAVATRIEPDDSSYVAMGGYQAIIIYTPTEEGKLVKDLQPKHQIIKCYDPEATERTLLVTDEGVYDRTLDPEAPIEALGIPVSEDEKASLYGQLKIYALADWKNGEVRPLAA